MSNFFEKVWLEVSKIPAGKVATYGQIARILGTRDSRIKTETCRAIG